MHEGAIVRALFIAIVVALLAPVHGAVFAQDNAYSLESRAAIGAHHLCSGLWVVGRVTKRTAAEVLAQDIAPFKDFSWDSRFTTRRRRKRHGHGERPRHSVAHGNVQRGSGLLDSSARRDRASISNQSRCRGTCRTPRHRRGRWATRARRVRRRRGGVDCRARLGHGADAAQHPRDRRVHGGKIVGERYAPGWTKDTPQISWSAGKSITAALVGILVRAASSTLDDFAPVKEWRGERRSARPDPHPRSAAHEQRPGLRQPRA